MYSKINITQVYNAEDFDIAMSKYNSIEYSNIYAKTFRSLCKYCRNEPDLD